MVTCFVNEMSAPDAARTISHDIKTVRKWYDRLNSEIQQLAGLGGLEAESDWRVGKGITTNLAGPLPIKKSRVRQKKDITIRSDAWVRRQMQDWSTEDKCRFFEQLLLGLNYESLVTQIIDPITGRSDMTMN